MNEYRKFALALGLLPWIPAFILHKHNLDTIAIEVLCVFIGLSVLSFMFIGFAKILKHTLDKIGAFLGKYLAIIVLVIGYIVAVIPTGMLMKIVKRDRLKLKKPNVKSYWLDYENRSTDYEYQF